MAIAGGYVRYNPSGNMKLGAVMTGTTMAWYTMPGWEVNYLWGNSGPAEMNPIALGNRFTEYVVSGMTPEEVLKFLDRKRNQVVQIATSAANHTTARGGEANCLWGEEETEEVPQFTCLRATFAEAAQPPTTYIRQGAFDLGGCLTMMAGMKLFSEAKETDFVYHAIGKRIGMKNTERLFENTGSKRNTILLMIMLGGHAQTWGLPWADVPLVNGKTSFGLIADKLRGSKVGIFTPTTGFTMKKSIFHRFAKKDGALGKAAKAVGAFI